MSGQAARLLLHIAGLLQQNLVNPLAVQGFLGTAQILRKNL